MLADSNILTASAPAHPLQDWLIRELPGVSAVTLIETLGYHSLLPRRIPCAANKSLFRTNWTGAVTGSTA